MSPTHNNKLTTICPICPSITATLQTSNSEATKVEQKTVSKRLTHCVEAAQSRNDTAPHCYQAQGKWQHRHGSGDQNLSCCSQG